MDSPLLSFVGIGEKEVQCLSIYLTSQSSTSLSLTPLYTKRFKGQSVLHDPPLLSLNRFKSPCPLQQLSLACQLASSATVKIWYPHSQHTVKPSMLNITVLHGWLMVLPWISDRNMSHSYTLAVFYVNFRNPRAIHRGNVFYGSLIADVFSTLQTILGRSAQLVMDIPTCALTCRFLSDSWRKRICRAQEFYGRSRVPRTLSLHPPSLHCCCPVGRSCPSTHRRPKCLNIRNTLRHLKPLCTLWLHSSLFIPFTLTERHLNSQKVRRKWLVHEIPAKLTFRLVNVYSKQLLLLNVL